jgi:hypothetical protein
VRFSGPRLERDLGDLARGAVAEIDVRRRGRVSGRIRTSQIVGSGGEATATGAQLRARLGLRDTWAFFARVTTRADGGALTGSVSPTRGTLRLQRRSGGRWVTRRRVRTDARGRYRVRVRPGRWRLEHRGWAAGPSVRIPRA